MNAIRIRAHFAAAACACLLTSSALAQTPAKAPARAPVAAGPWAKVPAFPTGCFEYVDDNQADPFYAKLEAAETAIKSDIDRQEAINEKIAEEFRNIDPMEQAQRMQQWMMSNPQEAMAFVQAAQNAPASGQADQQAFQQQESANAADGIHLRRATTTYG